MITIDEIIKGVKKYAEEIDNLSYPLGDAPPGGDIRLRANWIKKLMEELEKEEHILRKEIKREGKILRELNYVLGKEN